MKHLQKIFLQGLVTFLPMAVTIYVVYAGVQIVDNIFGNALRKILPMYIPGLGFLLTIIFIFFLGILLNNLITAGLLQSLEKRLTKVPFIKAIYSPLRDLMNLFNKSGSKEMRTAVLVDIGNGAKVLGLVTRESFKDLPQLVHQTDNKITVYIPLSYSLGGFTLLVSRSQVTEIDMPTEKAMSLAITGWVKVSEDEQNG